MSGILEFFFGLFGGFNEWLQSTIEFDENVLNLYNEFIAPIPEVFKLVGTVFLGIVIVLGTASFIKKMLKLFLILAVIIVIAMAMS